MLPAPHIMFYGPPGLGKTTLAEAVAEEIKTKAHVHTGQEVSLDTLYDVFSSIKFRDIFFIDEVHNTRDKVMEILYGPLQIINNMQLARDFSEHFVFEGWKISPFTFIGATTAPGLLQKPLRDRIILKYFFEYYSIEELSQILQQKGCPKASSVVIASRSRGTPRIALNFFIRMRNECLFEERITEEKAIEIFDRWGVYDKGVERNDLVILNYLKRNGTTSQSELYRTLGIDQSDYMTMYEPFLIKERYVKISSKGRSITEEGEEILALLER